MIVHNFDSEFREKSQETLRNPFTKEIKQNSSVLNFNQGPVPAFNEL